MVKPGWAASAAIAAVWAAGPAAAAELSVGAYAHDVAFVGQALGMGAADREAGADIQLGVRSGRIAALRAIGAPQAQAFVSLNTDGTSDFAAAGLAWPIRLTPRLYLRPGLGLAYTDGKARLPPANAAGLSPAEFQRRLHLFQTRIDFGSRTLFAPEIALGARLDRRWSAELSWVHLSNGQIFHHGKNQGLDDVGVRVVYALGAAGR